MKTLSILFLSMVMILFFFSCLSFPNKYPSELESLDLLWGDFTRPMKDESEDPNIVSAFYPELDGIFRPLDENDFFSYNRRLGDLFQEMRNPIHYRTLSNLPYNERRDDGIFRQWNEFMSGPLQENSMGIYLYLLSKMKENNISPVWSGKMPTRVVLAGEDDADQSFSLNYVKRNEFLFFLDFNGSYIWISDLVADESTQLSIEIEMVDSNLSILEHMLVLNRLDNYDLLCNNFIESYINPSIKGQEDRYSSYLSDKRKQDLKKAKLNEIDWSLVQKKIIQNIDNYYNNKSSLSSNQSVTTDPLINKSSSSSNQRETTNPLIGKTFTVHINTKYDMRGSASITLDSPNPYGQEMGVYQGQQTEEEAIKNAKIQAADYFTWLSGNIKYDYVIKNIKYNNINTVVFTNDDGGRGNASGEYWFCQLDAIIYISE